MYPSLWQKEELPDKDSKVSLQDRLKHEKGKENQKQSQFDDVNKRDNFFKGKNDQNNTERKRNSK